MQYETSPKNRQAASVVLSIQLVLPQMLQVLQLHIQKQPEVQHSVMYDTGLEEYTVLVRSEPYVF